MPAPRLTVVAASLWLTACTSGPQPITDPDQRIAVGDVSVLPPRGDGWAIAEHNPHGLLLVKKSEPPRSVFALVLLGPCEIPDLEALRDRLVADAEADGESGRPRRLEFTHEIVAGDPDFVRLHRALEDQAVPGFEGQAFRMLSDSRHYLQPADELLVVLAVSQRVPPGEEPLDLAAEAAPFLESLQL